jgi:hypothetical protein
MDRATSTDDMDPIDLLEHIANDCAWTHARADSYSLVIERTLLHGTYGMHVSDEENLVRFVSVRDFDCPGFAELELLRLIGLLNESVTPGSFSYSKSAKRIKYRTTLDFSDERPLTGEMIERRVNEMLIIFEAAHYCFEGVAGRVSDDTIEVHPDSGIVCINPGMTALAAMELFDGGGIGHG